MMNPKTLAIYIIDTNDIIIPERRAEAVDFVNAQSDEIATLRAQLAEARELISEARIELEHAVYPISPSESVCAKLTAYLQRGSHGLR